VAYSRPAGMSLLIDAGVPAEARSPRWFTVRPEAHTALVRAARSPLLLLQRPPPSIDEEILAGRYTWTSYRPLGAWLGRYLLLPDRAQETLRRTSLATRYVELRESIDEAIHLPGPSHRSPTLLLLRDRPDTIQLQVAIDGEEVVRQSLSPGHDQVRLEALPAGDRVIRVSTQGAARVLLNQTDRSDAGWRRRLVVATGREPLDFIHLKREEDLELLMLRVHRPFDQASATRFAVEITGRDGVPGRPSVLPLESLTTTRYELRLIAATGERAKVFEVPGLELDEGHAFPIALGPDLPPGEYRVRVTQLEGEPAYVTLSQTQAGLRDLWEVRGVL